MTHTLRQVQRGLEFMYRIETRVDVADFVIGSAARSALGAGRAPREQLLLAERDGELEVALYIDEDALANLTHLDPRVRLDDKNLQDFLHAVEGVSHFVYVIWRAQGSRPFSPLELELQAEVDKYVTCLLTLWPQTGRPPADLRERLFTRFELEPDLLPEERDRYLCANENARAYAESLDSRYAAEGDVPGMLTELRHFYRLGAQEKLAHIAPYRY